ncbi:MAG: hypothetical protein ACUZ77_05205 [Candidatus Brocadiales bacterium]
MRKVIQTEVNSKLHLKRYFFWLWCVLLTFGISGTLSADEFSDSIQLVSQEKLRVEGTARMLLKEKPVSSDRKQQEARLHVGVFYYKDARAAFNGWVDGIISDLKSGKGVDEIDKKIDKLSFAIDKSNKFVNFVKSGRPAANDNDPVIDIMTGIIEGLFGIREIYVDTKEEEKKKEMLIELEKIKIRSLYKIKLEAMTTKK